MGKRSKKQKNKSGLTKDDFKKQLFIKSETKSDRELFDSARKFYNLPPFIEHKEKKLHHMMVNHIRHVNTSYDNVLNNMRRNRLEQYYPIIKSTVLKLIGQEYPFLKDECIHQQHSIWTE